MESEKMFNILTHRWVFQQESFKNIKLRSYNKYGQNKHGYHIGKSLYKNGSHQLSKRNFIIFG